MSVKPVFGIDLGTTYSCIAYVDEFNKPVVVANFENERTTPSVVFFDEGNNIVVGSEAKNMLNTDPDKVVSFIKRFMGDQSFSFIHNGTAYRPEQISGFILKKLIKDASEKMGYPITDVVITCPAYFGINERGATKIAGVEFAGVNVVGIIEEPVAAAIAYGIDKEHPQTIMVYDLGGGTFDVTIIQISPESIRVVVTGGDHQLGGKDWDLAIMNYCAHKFSEETGIKDDILSNSETYGDLQLAVEGGKKTLTAKEKTKIPVRYEGEKVTVELTRDKFNELTADLLERTIMLTRQMLDDAKNIKGVSSFDKVLMVGGSTKMPQIKERLEKEFRGIPVDTFDPDESVAKGAAIYGQQETFKKLIENGLKDKLGLDEKTFDIDKIPENVVKEMERKVALKNGFGLGPRPSIETVASKSFALRLLNQHGETKLFNLITKQRTLPAEEVITCSTVKVNQTTVLLPIYENDITEAMDDGFDTDLGKQIGQGAIENLPPNLPEGSPILVTFKLDKEGLLQVHGVDKAGNREVSFNIQTSAVISGDKLAKAKESDKKIIVS